MVSGNFSIKFGSVPAMQAATLRAWAAAPPEVMYAASTPNNSAKNSPDFFKRSIMMHTPHQ